MAGSFFLDQADFGSWRALNGLAINLRAAASGAPGGVTP